MIITKLEKKKRLYLMELDEAEQLYVTEDTLVRFFLTKGKAISPKELEEIKQFAQFSHGKNLALYHLSFKSRTCKEVKDYLLKQEVDEGIVPAIIAQLKADKWLDDHRYAQQIIDSNFFSGDKGPYVLQQKLTQKGVSSSLVEDLLSDKDFTEVAERVAKKAWRKYAGRLPIRALQDKLIQYLINKGFSYQLASSAISQLEIETDEEEEETLLLAELEKQERKYARKYEGYELKQRLKLALARKGYDFSAIERAIRDYF